MMFFAETTRDLMIDRLLQEMEERGEALPDSRPAEAVVKDQPES